MALSSACRAALFGGLALALGAVAPGAAAPSDRADDRGEPDLGLSAFNNRHYEEARQIWRDLAERGDPRGAFGLGLLNDLGVGGAQNAAETLRLFLRAANAQFAPAQFNVAVMYDSGIGVARDPAAAAAWYARAAAHEYGRAQYNLAQLYQNGEGAPRNIALAKVWFEAAAANGLDAATTKAAAARIFLSSLKPPAAVTLTPAIPTPLTAEAIASVGDKTTLELCWSAPAQQTPVEYYVQIISLASAPAGIAFSAYTERSALLARLPAAPADYAWRVYTVAPAIGDYAPSAWSYFSVR
ncbi:Sel1 domain protein repeat-containing protein [Methylocella silvestris BL2]|uniref:Sel1 domain protein repeat-containing protein n=1 Tax=Methylocella silvestris (strain DSM 15510 / CIP 108128 / LMG 27833 / NCIMB 13906 / BL2) TaxID=395965 RepID=B8EK19_METSB|nr:SEL1-like repeat protein [Methylocella silvestris]ACK49966.1 Sel1 domain protein repeat-containing protein [Methylocella silvestris BL2]